MNVFGFLTRKKRQRLHGLTLPQQSSAYLWDSWLITTMIHSVYLKSSVLFFFFLFSFFLPTCAEIKGLYPVKEWRGMHGELKQKYGQWRSSIGKAKPAKLRND